MAEKLGKEETVTVDELIASNSYELAAMFNILERKGLINKAEFLEEVKRLHREVKPPVDPDPYVIRD
jgi:hypothetical protein